MKKLTTRKCNDCGDEFDLIADKYFLKKPNRFKRTIGIVIKAIIPNTINLLKHEYKFETKLICEMCNRNNKLKNLGI